MIKYLFMDIDGTLTDGKIYVGVDGEVFKAFNVKDGYGITTLLPQYHITPIVITGRSSTIVEKRCSELKIGEIHQGCHDKYQKILEIVNRLEKVQGRDEQSALNKCAYIGDDIPDLQCMEAIKNAGGVTGCPRDAATQVVRIADFVAAKCGGQGAVREFIEFLISMEEKERSR